MKTGCESKNSAKRSRTVKLPVLPDAGGTRSGIRKSKTSRWRAAALITLHVLMIAHIIQWRINGTTISPIEPSEAMYTLQNGAVTAGFVFFSLAILATLIFGRFVCGWGCHIVALQDLCAWLLKKFGLTPKPLRSRLLIYVPLIAALYMFVWPTVLRSMTKPKGEPLIPGFSNHLVTTEFWATFPTIAVAVPFLFICGFVTVYFLGSKGFCTYGCPYGGFFGIADKFASGRIRVTDACNQCGHCTATCTSNVLVHAEVKKFGMVVDPGCMKCMDCVSVCPNDALYFGFGKPSIAVSQAGPKTYSLTWPEEIFAAVFFALSFFAVWDVYQLVPMLMALGIACVTTFLTMKTWRLLRSKELSFYRSELKTRGRPTRAGILFLAFALFWIGLNTHSGWIRYHERSGDLRFQTLQIPDELALAALDPGQWLEAEERSKIEDGKRHLNIAFDYGLFTNHPALPKLAWFEYLSGDPDKAVFLLGAASDHQSGQGKAMSLYYRGAILNRKGDHDEALGNLVSALAERPDLTAAREEMGESLWQLGRKADAVSVWSEALRSNPNLPIANNFLAGALSSQGRSESLVYERQADRITPGDPYFHWMLGLRLRNVGMTQLAEKHFTTAVRIDPRFQARRDR